MMLILESLRDLVTADQTIVHDQAAIATFAAALDDLAALPPASHAHYRGWDATRSELLRLWSASITSYTVFAVIDYASSQSRVTVTSSYTKPLSEVRGANPDGAIFFDYDVGDAGKRRWKDRLRDWLGVQPWIYRFPLGYERASPSYNLRFVGAEDQYVFRLSVRRKLEGEVDDTPAHLAATRSSESHTMSFAHLYLRPIEGVHSRGELRARVAVRERPPGVLGLVAVVGLAQLAVLIGVLAVYSRIFDSESGAEVAALLLAAPSIVYAWIGNQLGPGRLSRVPLAAVGGLALNAFLSIFAAILALWAANDVDPWSFALFGVDIAHPLWLSLVVVASWGVANQAMRWRQNTLLFVRRERATPAIGRFVV
jgi:hypothetical protein